jgi:hypothetical protein
MITELGETQMQIGIDSFATAYDDASLAVSASDRLRNLVEQIEFADQVGLDVFGVVNTIVGTTSIRRRQSFWEQRPHEHSAYVSRALSRS